MGGWMDGWMDGWIDGWMKKHTHPIHNIYNLYIHVLTCLLILFSTNDSNVLAVISVTHLVFQQAVSLSCPLLYNGSAVPINTESNMFPKVRRYHDII